MCSVRALARGVAVTLCAALALTCSACRTQSSVREAEALLAAGDPLAARDLLLAETGRPSASAEAWWTLGRIEGGLADWHAARGLAALEGGDHPGARHHLEQALEIVPGHPQALAGSAALGARLAQRESARDLLAASIDRGDWSEAFRAATLLTPADLAREPRLAALAPDGRTPLDALRARVQEEIDRGFRAALAREDLPAARGMVDRAEELLSAYETGVPTAAPQLERWIAASSALVHSRESAEHHHHRAVSELELGAPRQSWRHARLALQRNPDDPQLRKLEREVREVVRERAVAALGAAEVDCDTRAARAALDALDELGDGWPADAPAPRSEVERWIRDELVRAAFSAERHGRTGTALLLWLAIAAEGGPPDAVDRARHRADRLVARFRDHPRVVARHLSEPPAIVPHAGVEVVLLPLRVERSLERRRVVQPGGWMRTGSSERADPWHDADLRRALSTLLECVELRDTWVASRPSRAALSERRLRFRMRELSRLSARVGRLGPTRSRVEWNAEDLVLLEEARTIRVSRPLLLLREGYPPVSMSVAVEGTIAGSLPEECLPGVIESLPPGAAQLERLRLRLDAECGRLVPERIEEIRHSELDRLRTEARRVRAAGRHAEAVEMMAEAWARSDADDPGRDRAGSALVRWCDLVPEALEHRVP